MISSELGASLEGGKGGFELDLAGLKCCWRVLKAGRIVDAPMRDVVGATLVPPLTGVFFLAKGSRSIPFVVVVLLDRMWVLPIILGRIILNPSLDAVLTLCALRERAELACWDTEAEDPEILADAFLESPLGIALSVICGLLATLDPARAVFWEDIVVFDLPIWGLLSCVACVVAGFLSDCVRPISDR